MKPNSGILNKIFLIIILYFIAIAGLYIPLFGVNLCFNVKWKDEIGNYFNLSTGNLNFDKNDFWIHLVECVSGCLTKDGKLDWIAISIWNSLFRPIWCSGIGFVVIICEFKFGFLINWLLSCKVWSFCNRN